MEPENILLRDGDLCLIPMILMDPGLIFDAVKESIEDLKPWMSWCHEDYSLEDSSLWLSFLKQRWPEGKEYQFAIKEVTTGIFLGGCGLNHIHPVYHFANLGYWVRSSQRGQGIAARAARLAAQFGFSEVGIIRAEIVTAYDNYASQRVARKAGAVREGVLRNRMVVGKRFMDGVMYSLVPADFGMEAKILRN